MLELFVGVLLALLARDVIRHYVLVWLKQTVLADMRRGYRITQVPYRRADLFRKFRIRDAIFAKALW